MSGIETIFLASAIVGAGVLVLSALLGFAGHGGHHSGHVGHQAGHHVGAHHATHLHSGHAEWSAFGRTILSILNPVSLAMSLAYFGLLGFILSTAGFGTEFTLPIAIVFGLASARLTAQLVSRLLMSGEQSSHAIVRDFLGRIGEVIVAIPEKGVGEIALTSGGSRLTYPAKADGPISAGARVMVEDFEHGVATVSRYSE